MSVIIQGYQLREIAFGPQVIKAAQTLPQTATENLFTVSGGAVLVTSLIGVVSTALGSTEPLLSLGIDPTTGTAEAAGISIATAASGGTTIVSLEVGSKLTLNSSAGVAAKLVSSSNAGSAVWLSTPFVVPEGTITWTTGANNTGAISWYLTYVPLDTGASVS